MASITKSRSRPAAPAPVVPLAPPRETPTLQVAMVTIDEDSAGQRLDNFLIARLKGVPKSHIYRIVRGGEVRVNKGRVDVSHRLAEGEVVRIPPIRVAAAEDLESAASQANSAGMARQNL